MWFARSTSGYGGKGSKPSGYEHHRVHVSAGGIKVTSEIAFKNFGVHRYKVTSDQARRKSQFDYGDGEITVDVSCAGGGWSGRAKQAGETTKFPLDQPVESGMPSLCARFLPVALPRERGELAAYAPVPEDGFPAWAPRPEPGRSWFPVAGGGRSNQLRALTVVGRGEGTFAEGRKTFTGFRYDHVGPDGAIAATTWIGDDDTVLRFERMGCVLMAVPQERALALDPGDA